MGHPSTALSPVLTPIENFSRNTVFSSPAWASANTDTALSRMVDFYPVDGLYLDGVNLDYLDWNVAGGNTAAFATVYLSHGHHHLYCSATNHENG